MIAHSSPSAGHPGELLRPELRAPKLRVYLGLDGTITTLSVHYCASSVRAGKSSLCNVGIGTTARDGEIAQSWRDAGAREDVKLEFRYNTVIDENAVLSDDIFERAPNGESRPAFAVFEDHLCNLPGASPAKMLERMAKVFDAEKNSFAGSDVPFAKTNIGPLPVFSSVKSDPTTFVPTIIEPTEAGDGRFYALFRWVSVKELEKILTLTRAWWDDQSLSFSEEEDHLIKIGQDLLGFGEDKKPKPTSRVRDRPSAQWTLPWALRVLAGAKLKVSFAAPDPAAGSSRLALELLKHAYGDWAPWAAIAFGGCTIRLPYNGPAILESQGLLDDNSSRDSTLLEVMRRLRHRIHNDVMFPFMPGPRMAVHPKVVCVARRPACCCFLPVPLSRPLLREGAAHCAARVDRCGHELAPVLCRCLRWAAGSKRLSPWNRVKRPTCAPVSRLCGTKPRRAARPVWPSTDLPSPRRGLCASSHDRRRCAPLPALPPRPGARRQVSGRHGYGFPHRGAHH